MERIYLRQGFGVSSLRIDDKCPQSLIVTGNLLNGIEIAPRDVEAARKLIAWLEHWIVSEEEE